MVTVYDVIPGSAADEAGIRAGDCLLSVNGHDIADVLDYSFYMAEKTVRLVLMRDGRLIEPVIRKSEYGDIGLEFETFLMDHKKSCHNKCVFCFIDQLPKGLREPLYFKDDDARLSFLQGNYVTTTNMSDHDIDRIIRMKMSPINISVHTTNPALRVRMMNNKNAGRIMDILRRFADAGITMNCQIVLCRTLNDGAELDRTMGDLVELYPAINSVSVVPAGLTAHREGLYPLTPFTPEECRDIIHQVERFAEMCYKQHGSHIFYLADEFYVKAGEPVQPESYYEGFPQIENGVGMMSSMQSEFEIGLHVLNQYDLNQKRRVSLATGVAAYEFIRSLVRRLEEKAPNLHCNVYCIENRFFGPQITVAGLLTGKDVAEQLREKRLGQKLFLPACMLRADGEVLLDDMTPAQLEEVLGVKIEFVESGGYQLIEALLS